MDRKDLIRIRNEQYRERDRSIKEIVHSFSVEKVDIFYDREKDAKEVCNNNIIIHKFVYL